ncbi:hypothetical protein [Oenococcus sp.]|uniref:hypothetical protein n=1 Tax=Oenococcus sp. TaxID=1979414 RepID=UPI0039EB0B9E
MLLVGIGQGLALSTLTISGIANTRADIAGSASGVVNTFHQIGNSFGLSLVTALTAQIKTPLNEFNHAFGVIALLMLFSLIASLGILLASLRKRQQLAK